MSRPEPLAGPSEELYRQMFERNQAVQLLLDPIDGTILNANPAAAEFYGYPREDLIGRKIWEINTLSEAEIRVELSRAASEQQCHFIFRHRLASREERDVEIHSSPINIDGRTILYSIVHDITERVRAESALSTSMQKYRDIVDFAPIGIYQSTREGRLLTANESFARLLGYERVEDILTKPMGEHYFDPGERERLIEDLGPSVNTVNVKVCLRRRDGSPAWVELFVHSIRDARGELHHYEGFAFDISGRREAENLQNALFRIAEKASTSEDIDELYAAVHAIVGGLMDARNFYIALLDEESSTLSFPYLVDPHDRRPDPRPLYRGLTEYVLRTGEPLLAPPEIFDDLVRRGEVESVGTPSIDWLGVPLRTAGRTFGVIVVQSYSESVRFTDREKNLLTFVSRQIASAIESKRAEAQIRYLAFHDGLTGLPNRLLFQDRLQQVVAQAHRIGANLAVMFLDLDRFKIINDSLGHTVGDELLRAIASRVPRGLREGDTLARIGGDEFILLLPGIRGVGDAMRAAEKILNTFRLPFQVGSHELYVSASIGVSVYPFDGADAETLVRNADSAMYRAKERGRDNFQLYTAELNLRAQERLGLEYSLRQALNRSEFRLLYQPLVHLRDRTVFGVEALVYWEKVPGSLVAPGEFIPISEETGLILPLGAWVLRTACEEMQRFRREGAPAVRLSVNLSARQFQQPDLAGQVAEVLRSTGFPAADLDLEITESVAMETGEESAATFRGLRELGVRLTLDDFGTGYSSLAYLTHLPLDTIKVDRTFVRDLTADLKAAAVVRAILALASGMGLAVVAEGVETQEQRSFLERMGCERMQGYLFSRPVPLAALSERMRMAFEGDPAP